MSYTQLIQGDLLNPNPACHLIIQQLNCLCVRPHGLSEAIAKKYPYANVYANRTGIGRKNLAILADRGTPGDIVISQPKEIDGPIVVGLYGQYDFGKAYQRSYRPALKNGPETKQHRITWFQNALNLLVSWLDENNYNTDQFIIGIPYGIGCGLAGGDWKIYSQMLENFASRVKCQVKIFKLPA